MNKGPDTVFHRRLKFTIVLFTACILALLAALRGADLWWRRDQAIALGERRAANLALILSEYLRETLQATDSGLKQLAVHSRQVGGPSAAPEAWTTALASTQASLGVGAWTVVDATGIIRHSTLKGLVGQSRFDSYAFQRLRTDRVDALIAGDPFPTLDRRRLIIPLGRLLTTPDGQFDGIIAASFEPEGLRTFFKSVDVGQGGRVSVLHPTGVLLFQEPSAINPIGSSVRGSPVFEAAQGRGGAGTVRWKAPTGAALLTAFRPIHDPPLIVAVSLDERELLADSQREVLISAGVLALLCLLAGLVLYLAFREFDARVRAEQALGHAQRLDSLGQLTGGVAHDFNNLLTAILGYAELLHGSAESDAQRADVSEIIKAGNSAAVLTKQLLTFSRKQVLETTIVDLNALVDSLARMLRRLIGEHIELVTTLAPGLSHVRVDAGQIEQVIMNLAVNARDAMPDGGRLSIATADVDLDETIGVMGGPVAPGPYVMLSIADTGVGMSDETKRHAFEPFFTTKAVGTGTGLGLATVYGIVKQSGGHLWVYSELGLGTTFKIYLPQAHASGLAAPRALPRTRTAGGTETVLLVEDEEAVRVLARAILERAGYDVIAAANPRDALEAFDRQPVDLLVTDVVMPGGNGVELYEQLSAKMPGLRVLYMSGHTGRAIVDRAQLSAEASFLEKPFTADGLVLKVRDVLDR